MNGNLFWAVILFLSVQMLVSCTGQLSENVQTENLEREIHDIWTQFIQDWESEDAAACASIYHSDALNIPQALQVNSGADSIEEFYAALFSNNQSSRYNHRSESIHFDQKLAVEYALFDVQWITNEGDEWTYSARALIHWEKDETENWKIRKMLFNNPPESV